MPSFLSELKGLYDMLEEFSLWRHRYVERLSNLSYWKKLIGMTTFRDENWSGILEVGFFEEIQEQTANNSSIKRLDLYFVVAAEFLYDLSAHVSLGEGYFEVLIEPLLLEHWEKVSFYWLEITVHFMVDLN